MPDILIRGMAMPKDGRKHTALLQFLEDGKCRGIVEYSKSYDDRSVNVFEVVPLPEGHGRLIDGDALMPDFVKARWAFFSDGDTFLQLLKHATTIVPAEGGTEECSEN